MRQGQTLLSQKVQMLLQRSKLHSGPWHRGYSITRSSADGLWELRASWDIEIASSSFRRQFREEDFLEGGSKLGQIGGGHGNSTYPV